MALKDFEYDILRGRAWGHCVRCVWSFYVGGEPVTREVRTLQKRGHVSITYYAGLKAGVNATDIGRKRLEFMNNQE